MKKESLVILVEQSARVRGEASVPKEYILKALEKIELGEESVEKYPTGFPSLKGGRYPIYCTHSLTVIS